MFENQLIIEIQERSSDELHRANNDQRNTTVAMISMNMPIYVEINSKLNLYY